MKILVFGCNGMAGHTISLYFKEKGYEVMGFDRQKSKIINSISGDAMDAALVKKIVSQGNYDAIINCIGILNKAAEDNKSIAVYLNSYFPHFLAEITKNMKTKIIHMSTDCVFSGKRGEYTENDFQDGTTFYDRSKALGELNDSKNLTLRNSIVGPDINPNGIGLLNWFMQQKQEINGYSKSMWTGQTTLQLAKTMEYALLHSSNGLVNAVPSHSISKYELCKLFNKHLRNNELKINKIDGINADKSLLRTNFDFDYIIPDYEKQIKELAEWIFEHENLYPHYFLRKGEQNV